MTLLAIFLLCVILIYLAFERYRARCDRQKIDHVVYVNGIRGKSTVTRLIDAGLREGGIKTFCKTTGTLPMTISVDNIERMIYRRGRANIKEQLKTLHLAANSGAQVLVLECMAVDPQLQYVTQHDMLLSDIGVITNVRFDHTAEMGDTLEEICDSLCNTIPRNGVLFTADKRFFSHIKQKGEIMGCQTYLALPTGKEPEFDFPENLALALAVCRHLGVDDKTAIEGMLKYQRDPYSLSIYRLNSGGIFVNGLSINDPQSIIMVYDRLKKRFDWTQKKMVLLINNRPDRGYRTKHMIEVAGILDPQRVWITGASQVTVARALRKRLPDVILQRFSAAEELCFCELTEDKIVFAIGNVAGPGREVMERVKKEGREYVP